jgi:hypothetical protein
MIMREITRAADAHEAMRLARSLATHGASGVRDGVMQTHAVRACV